MRRGREVSLHATEYLLCLPKPSGESMNGRMKLNKKMVNILLYVDEVEVNTDHSHLSVTHSMSLSLAYLYALCRSVIDFIVDASFLMVSFHQ